MNCSRVVRMNRPTASFATVEEEIRSPDSAIGGAYSMAPSPTMAVILAVPGARSCRLRRGSLALAADLGRPPARASGRARNLPDERVCAMVCRGGLIGIGCWPRVAGQGDARPVADVVEMTTGCCDERNGLQTPAITSPAGLIWTQRT